MIATLTLSARKPWAIDKSDVSAAIRPHARCGYLETGRVKYRGAPLVYYELAL